MPRHPPTRGSTAGRPRCSTTRSSPTGRIGPPARRSAVGLHPDRAAGLSFALNIEIIDGEERHLVSVGNSVLIHEEGVTDLQADGTVRLPRAVLLTTLFGVESAIERIAAGDIQVAGQAGLYEALVGLIEIPDPNFAIVVP